MHLTFTTCSIFHVKLTVVRAIIFRQEIRTLLELAQLADENENTTETTNCISDCKHMCSYVCLPPAKYQPDFMRTRKNVWERPCNFSAKTCKSEIWNKTFSCDENIGKIFYINFGYKHSIFLRVTLIFSQYLSSHL